MSLHIQKFNQRVQNMNQSGGRELTLGAREARDLQSEIFSLLAQIAEMERKLNQPQPQGPEVAMDGGGFR